MSGQPVPWDALPEDSYVKQIARRLDLLPEYDRAQRRIIAEQYDQIKKSLSIIRERLLMLGIGRLVINNFDTTTDTVNNEMNRFYVNHLSLCAPCQFSSKEEPNKKPSGVSSSCG